MSTCISRSGEYGSHTLGTGREAFTCQRCFVLDEDALLDALAEVTRERDEARERLARVEALDIIGPPGQAIRAALGDR